MKINLDEWTMPRNYFGATWEGHYVFLGQNRDSDALDRSNFRSALKAIGDESEHENGVTVVHEGHWACGWIEWIAIPFGPSIALAKACEIQEGLESYPVVNESDWSELETEEADEVWARCYDRRERVEYIRDNPIEFDFRDWSEMKAVVNGEYFIGYASELLA